MVRLASRSGTAASRLKNDLARKAALKNRVGVRFGDRTVAASSGRSDREVRVRVRVSPKDLQKALNDDSEFRIAGRYWDGSLRFEFGAEICRLELRGGEVISIDTAASEPGRGDVVIKAPVGDWAKLLEEVPPPFYQEFYPASMHHGFRLEGDPDYIWPYYWALRRSGEILRSVASVEKD
jgi:hypothetical protein